MPKLKKDKVKVKRKTGEGGAIVQKKVKVKTETREGEQTNKQTSKQTNKQDVLVYLRFIFGIFLEI